MNGVLIAAIIATTIAITVLTIAVVYRPRRHTDPKTQRLLEDAANLFGTIRTPRSLDHMDVLTSESADAIAQWLARFDAHRTRKNGRHS